MPRGGSKINVLGGVWGRGFMFSGDTLILVISRGVQLFYGIAQPETSHAAIRLTLPMGGGGDGGVGEGRGRGLWISCR